MVELLVKKSVSVLFLSFFAMFAVAQQKPDTAPYAPEYHRQRLETFRKETVKEGEPVFLGDSITEFGDWRALLGNPAIINRGIAGDITFGVMARLDDVIFLRPSKLFVAIGINDIAKNNQDKLIVQNIFTIVRRVKTASPETRIYVSSILPTNDEVKKEYPQAYGKNAHVARVNRLLKNGAKRHGFTYLDTYVLFSDSDGKLSTKYAETDGLHLNAAAYKLWAEMLRKLL